MSVIPHAAEIRAWTRNQLRTRRAYQLHLAALAADELCPRCGAKREGRRWLCQRCRKTKTTKETR